MHYLFIFTQLKFFIFNWKLFHCDRLKNPLQYNPFYYRFSENKGGWFIIISRERIQQYRPEKRRSVKRVTEGPWRWRFEHETEPVVSGSHRSFVFSELLKSELKEETSFSGDLKERCFIPYFFLFKLRQWDTTTHILLL